ncbi:hypothetical protein CLOM_g14814 [Closterium sp. NIES-68]|nr:hypothetical protein CLOM_g14814 [Closterium sp. NIES-68]
MGHDDADLSYAHRPEATSRVFAGRHGTGRGSQGECHAFGDEDGDKRFETADMDSVAQRGSSHCVDERAAATWIYPSNRELRQYQYEIAEAALFANTLVCLPTGVGKTLIAAVAMVNYYRWFPHGKIVFMAPTRPLVLQQIRACHNVVAIPQEHTMHMTGQMAREQRAQHWRERRVFFVTGQVLLQDMVQWGACPRESIVCLVVDEAHRATGNYAYARVVEELNKAGVAFRVLALTATPGSKLPKVQEVVDKLGISRIEYRGDDDPDVAKYMHNREEHVLKVRMHTAVAEVEKLLLAEQRKCLEALNRLGAVSSALVSSNKMVSSHQLRMIQEQRERARQQEAAARGFGGEPMGGREMAGQMWWARAEAVGAVLERLMSHGMRSALHVIERSRALAATLREQGMQRALTIMRRTVGVGGGKAAKGKQGGASSSASAPMSASAAAVSPKLVELEKLLLQHFGSAQQCSAADTRAIIFSTFRDSVQEIVECLSQHEPMLRVKQFIGQSAGVDAPQRKRPKASQGVIARGLPRIEEGRGGGVGGGRRGGSGGGRGGGRGGGGGGGRGEWG